MSEALLEQYIRNQIFILEKNSYYDNDLLEENRVLDFFKNTFNKVKDVFIANPDTEQTFKDQIEKAEKKGKLKRAEKFNQMLDDLHTSRFRNQTLAVLTLFCAFVYTKEINKGKSPEQAAQTTIEQVDNSMQGEGNRLEFDIGDTSLEAPLEERGFERTTLSQEEMLKAMYLLTGTSEADFESEDSPSENASQNQLDEMFFEYMEKAYSGVTTSTFDEMSQDDYDIFVDQFDTFVENNAFNFTENEHRKAMSLAYLAGSSKHVRYSSDDEPYTNDTMLNDIRGFLTATDSAKSTLDNLYDTVSDSSVDINNPEMLKKIKSHVENDLEKLEKLRKKAEEQGSNTDKYNSVIEKIKKRYEDYFNESI